MYRFKLNTGIHSEGGVTYLAGSTIETENDLRKHNVSSERYTLVDTFEALSTSEEVPEDLLSTTGEESTLDSEEETSSEEIAPEEVSNDYEKMTVADLKEFAEAEEIPLRSGLNKADIIATIRAATQLS
jgi:hypothetical protein